MTAEGMGTRSSSVKVAGIALPVIASLEEERPSYARSAGLLSITVEEIVVGEGESTA